MLSFVDLFETSCRVFMCFVCVRCVVLLFYLLFCVFVCCSDNLLLVHVVGDIVAIGYSCFTIVAAAVGVVAVACAVAVDDAA